MYDLFIITLKDCFYCEAAINLLNSFKIKYKHLKVNRNEKEKFKTPEINTFPQVYLKKNNNTLLLGGYDNLKEFIDKFINQKYNEKEILQFHNKYKLWNKKSILRLIKIINQK